jgi:salicylate hydroxylase
VNFVAVVEQDSWTRESWTDPGDPADAIAAFEGWHPQLHEILGAVDETFIWALFDRPPLARWSRGRVTLLGDACHPMLPFMAQGAAQALEDGATLTACLTGEADIPSALRRYEQLRVPRASAIQALSTENKTRFHLPDGERQRERDAQMAGGGTDFAVRAVEWIYAHDAAAVATSA